MKKISVLFLSFTVAVLSMVSLSSCSSPESVAQDFVEEINKQKAAFSQAGLTLEGAKIEGKKIVITTKMDIVFGEMKAIMEESMKSKLSASALASQFGTMDKAVFKKLIEGGYSIVYCYKDSTGDLINIEISNAELKAAI